jgi:hypothetical protein
MLGWRFRLGLAIAALMLLQGCASLKGPDPTDPLEPLNRQVTAFNDVADDLVLRPVAVIYGQYLPTVVRKGIGNFFSNQSDVLSFFNSLAQLKLEAAAKNAMRVGINSTSKLTSTRKILVRPWLFGVSPPAPTWSCLFLDLQRSETALVCMLTSKQTSISNWPIRARATS